MSGEKTEEPSAARLRKARAEGDSGVSLFASQAIALVAAVAILPATVVAVGARGGERLREAIARVAAGDVGPRFDVGETAKDVLVLSLPVLVAIAVAGAATSLVQSGGHLALRRLAARPGARPFALSRAHVFAVARGAVGAAIVAWVLLREIRLHAPDIVRTSGRLAFAAPTAARMGEAIGWKVALAGLGLAAVDLVVTRMLWRLRLRMSKDEALRERREAEGDPLVKAERARAQEEAIARGVIGDVRRGTIVVQAGSPGSRVACAVRYEAGDRAPVVLVTGLEESAQRIIRAALENGIPVREDEEVARALVDVTAGEPIPERLYDAVAELLADAAHAP